MDPILDELKQASHGLLFRSESDYPFEIIDLGIVDYSDPSPQQLMSMLGRTVETPAVSDDLQHFFRNMTRVRPEYNALMRLEAERFQKLQQLLLNKLTGVKVIRIGTINIEAYIIGKTSQNRLIGLKTRLVET